MEPDYRYTLANERTFLAWIRTSLGLLAAGVAVDRLITDLPGGLRVAGGLLLVAAAIASSVAGFLRWRRVQRRMRLGQPLGESPAVPMMMVLIVVLAVLVTLMIFLVS
ncbi:YidH family protein [Rhizohabitans arisaemae]|uniref:YidH family protein n=1 Tax=Rhizohabitans arisaemae TaxID=2720610 RepID=UPI0024B11CE5|nr:DUF202 domain-containing protein [Rhizohabitans arisaemae]